MAKREDPLISLSFALDLGGAVTGYFAECDGLGSESEVVEHKATGSKGQVIIVKMPGALKWSNIVLKRGVTSDMQIWEWRKKVEEGKIDTARKDGSVIMYDQGHNEVARWNFLSAWPVKVSGPKLDAKSNDYAVEELTIAHEGMNRVA